MCEKTENKQKEAGDDPSKKPVRLWNSKSNMDLFRKMKRSGLFRITFFFAI